MQDKIWQTIDLIEWGHNFFTSKKIPNSKLEIEWFLCDILKCERIDLYLKFEQPIMNNELMLFKQYITRRIKGEPFQHIIGKADFYGNDYIVDKNVLIPRPETQIIIDILKQKKMPNKILEIGTGSGCIAITICLENLCDSIIATDLSKKALQVAKQNAALHSVSNIEFKIHDFLKTSIHSNFDCIVSNPPYINPNEINQLQKEVINYDPLISLTDNNDGLSFYRKFAEVGVTILNQNGFMLLEFGGLKQVDHILNIFQSHPYKLQFHNDLQGDPRVVEVSLLT